MNTLKTSFIFIDISDLTQQVFHTHLPDPTIVNNKHAFYVNTCNGYSVLMLRLFLLKLVWWQITENHILQLYHTSQINEPWNLSLTKLIWNHENVFFPRLYLLIASKMAVISHFIMIMTTFCLWQTGKSLVVATAAPMLHFSCFGCMAIMRVGGLEKLISSCLITFHMNIDNEH